MSPGPAWCPRVILVTATDVVPETEVFRRLEAAGQLGRALTACLAVELRSPELEGRALLAFGERLRRATSAIGAALLVNDRLDLARALGADGVHLGRRSVPLADARAFLGENAWISIACHSVGETVDAARAGADAVKLSPIFASPGKGAPLGLAALREARAVLGERPWLVALGGIDASSAAACLDAGADAVAVVRADLGSTLRALLAR